MKHHALVVRARLAETGRDLCRRAYERQKAENERLRGLIQEMFISHVFAEYPFVNALKEAGILVQKEPEEMTAWIDQQKGRG